MQGRGSIRTPRLPIGGLSLVLLLLFLVLSGHQILRDHQGVLWVPSLSLGSRGPVPPQCTQPPTPLTLGGNATPSTLAIEEVVLKGHSFRTVRDALRNQSRLLSSFLTALNHTTEGTGATLFIDIGAGLGTVASLAASLGAYVVAVEAQAKCLGALQQLVTGSGAADRIALCHNAVGELPRQPAGAIACDTLPTTGGTDSPPANSNSSTAPQLLLEDVLPALQRWVPPSAMHNGPLNTCIFVAADGREPRVVAALRETVKRGLVRHVFIQLEPSRWVRWGMNFRSAMEPFAYLFQRSFPVRAVACTDATLLLTPGKGRTPVSRLPHYTEHDLSRWARHVVGEALDATLLLWFAL